MQNYFVPMKYNVLILYDDLLVAVKGEKYLILALFNILRVCTLLITGLSTSCRRHD